MKNAKPGSAYAKLHEKNRELIYRKRCDDSESESRFVSKRVEQTKRTVKKKRRPTTKPKKTIDKAPPAPKIENWRPAGGDIFEKSRRKKKQVQPTSTLGIARIATWRLDSFVEALKVLIEPHGEIDDIITNEVVHGGESVTNIWAEFANEQVAEAVKEKIDSHIILERKLQVKFA